jgi:activator of 2-hydroxyglutaryl-CoA dehydratase
MEAEKTYKMGIDIGSTTIKLVVVNEENNIIYKVYRRHNAVISEVLTYELHMISQNFRTGSFRLI